jgi:hypothetical protein
MKGADKIINMRLNGRKPPVINIWDYPLPGELELTEVVIHRIPTNKLDFRFVMDCLVTIASEDRNQELEDLCYEHGAKQVVSGPWMKYYS